MVRFLCVAGAVLWATTATAATQADQTNYAPPGNWVLPPPASTSGPTRPDAPLRVIYTDQQVRIGPDGEETYSAYRVRILKPEALQVGNISVTWQPSSGSTTVHLVRIWRDGRAIDVLKDHKFNVVQRENGLEQSILDGQLTAVLQAPDLRVGDELEFAGTTLHRDPTLGDHPFGIGLLPPQGAPGAFRFRLSWPSKEKLAWRATRDLPQMTPATTDGQTSVAFELRDPSGVVLDEGAPDRYNVRRLIEFSNFKRWGEISQRFAALFDEATTLSQTSALRAEAAKIAAASSDPGARAQAALQLVQDQIRYVYVGLDGGNYRPASADETWNRRFGDCKGKTAVLLALLRKLKIEAEPVLVNLQGGDGSDALLPNPSVFNHVLVRAKIWGASYWLDGTRLGDRHLDMLPAPVFRWALPVRTAGSDLEPVAAQALKRPQLISIVDIDASAGFDKPAQVKVQQVLRQDQAFALHTQLDAMAPEDADRAVRSYWRQQMDWVDPDHVSWRYDERRTTFVLSLSGEGKPDWKGSDKEGRSLTIIGAGFFPPDRRRRPKEQDQNAPWKVEFPRFNCYATTIRLPPPDTKWRWTYYSDHVERRLGATVYWRDAGLRSGVMRTVMSSQNIEPEMSAEEVKEVNDGIATFNNNMSTVSQVDEAGSGTSETSALPFADNVDWSEDSSACSAASHAEAQLGQRLSAIAEAASSPGQVGETSVKGPVFLRQPNAGDMAKSYVERVLP